MKTNTKFRSLVNSWILGVGLLSGMVAQGADNNPLKVCPGQFNPYAVIARGSTLGRSVVGFVHPEPQAQNTPRVNATGGYATDQGGAPVASPTQVASAVQAVSDSNLSTGSIQDEVPLPKKNGFQPQTSGATLPHYSQEGPSTIDKIVAFLNENVKGQPEAVEMAARFLASFQYGLTDPNRPAGIFVNAGVTGTGKTELVKAIAVYLTARGLHMPPEDVMIMYSGAELKGKHDISKITGAAPGLVGSNAGSRFNPEIVDKIKKNISTVLVLFDEIEKADKEIWDVILTVADDGMLTISKVDNPDQKQGVSVVMLNSDGTVAEPKKPTDPSALPGADADSKKNQTIQKANLRGSFMFLTMNIGQREIHATIDDWRLKHSQGGPSMYLPSGDFRQDFLQQVERECRRAVEKYFREDLGRPEIFERVDNVLWFRPGNRRIAYEIMLNEIAKFQVQRLAPNGDKHPHLLFSLSDEAERYLFSQLGDVEKFGYRMVRRTVQQNLQTLFLQILTQTRVTQGNGSRGVRTGDLIRIGVETSASQGGSPHRGLRIEAVEELGLPRPGGQVSIGDLGLIADKMMKDDRFKFDPHILDRLDALWMMATGFGIKGTVSPR